MLTIPDQHPVIHKPLLTIFSTTLFIFQILQINCHDPPTILQFCLSTSLCMSRLLHETTTLFHSGVSSVENLYYYLHSIAMFFIKISPTPSLPASFGNWVLHLILEIPLLPLLYTKRIWIVEILSSLPPPLAFEISSSDTYKETIDDDFYEYKSPYF